MISEKRVLKKKFWFTEKEIETYQQFFDCRLSDIRKRFLSNSAFTGLRPYLDNFSWHPVTHNKWYTANFYPNMGLKMAETYGFLHEVYGSTVSGKNLCSAKDLDAFITERELNQVVIKHVGGGVGSNLFIIDQIDKTEKNFSYQTNTGKILTHNDLEAILKRVDGGLTGYLVEERLHLHPEVRKITGDGLSSLRFETLQYGRHVNKVQYAYIRLGLEGMATDHSIRNGVYVPVDLDTGMMNKGLDTSRPIEDQWVSKHPLTGITFEGKTVPNWREFKEMALKASISTPGLHRVGWDLFPSSNGPRLLEGNVGGGIVIDQLMFGGFFDNGVFDDWMRYLATPKPDGSFSWRFKHWNKGRRLKPFEQFVSSILQD